MEIFLFKFEIHFRIILAEIIQTNREVWILTEVQCVKYHRIYFDKLYNLWESFFQISKSFSN